MAKQTLHIALVGNPNSGKSSLFNALTGLNQQVGNFPGVTVDKKVGKFSICQELEAEVLDLPGTYSLYPRREDEWVAYKVLMQEDNETNVDFVILVADASNLKRNLLFASQILDLKIPVIVALSMLDLAKQKDINIDVDALARELGVPVIPVNPRKGKGIVQLKKAIEDTATEKYRPPVRNFIDLDSLAKSSISGIKELLPDLSDYRAVHYLINHENFKLDDDLQKSIESVEQKNNFNPTKVQAE